MFLLTLSLRLAAYTMLRSSGWRGKDSVSSRAGAGHPLLQWVITGLVGTPAPVCCGASLGAGMCTLCALWKRGTTLERVLLGAAKLWRWAVHAIKTDPASDRHAANSAYIKAVNNFCFPPYILTLFHYHNSSMFFQTSKKQLFRISSCFVHAVFRHMF